MHAHGYFSVADVSEESPTIPGGRRVSACYQCVSSPPWQEDVRVWVPCGSQWAGHRGLHGTGSTETLPLWLCHKCDLFTPQVSVGHAYPWYCTTSLLAAAAEELSPSKVVRGRWSRMCPYINHLCAGDAQIAAASLVVARGRNSCARQVPCLASHPARASARN